MIPTIGHAAILVGLALTAYASVALFLAATGNDDGRLVASGRRAVIGSFAAALVGCVASHAGGVAACCAPSDAAVATSRAAAGKILTNTAIR